MTAIWSNDGERWALLAPSGFPDEATLHSLIEQTPQLLPLAGSPRLTIVGREVRLGSGSADLVAVEPNGRLVVIEVKLANNAEARRAVVAQVLTYAAYLHGVDRADLERGVLSGQIHDGDPPRRCWAKGATLTSRSSRRPDGLSNPSSAVLQIVCDSECPSITDRVIDSR
jgi:hypothetical protein